MPSDSADTSGERLRGAAEGRRTRKAVLRGRVAMFGAVAVALLVKAVAVEAFFIPSGLMERTLHGCTGCRGDRVLVDKLVYERRDIRRGEVVVFRGAGSWVGGAAGDNEHFIKRVIALPGDTVACCDSQGRVTVNGRSLQEPYLYADDRRPFGPVALNAGQLWMMGDNRGHSLDSRVNGPIPADHVVGRAFAVFWPASRWQLLHTADPAATLARDGGTGD